MPPDDIPEDIRQSYSCECGGEITKNDGILSCDTCDFVGGVEIETEEVI